MTAEVTINVDGLLDVKAALEALTADLRRRVVRSALRSAARPLIKEAKAQAPVLKYPLRRRRPGVMKSAIRAFNSKRANGQGGTLGIYVSVGASKKDLKRAPISGDPYYWRWVEGGHKIVPKFKGKYTSYRLRGRGRLTGLRSRNRAATRMVPPYSFLYPAYRTRSQEVIRLFTQKIVERIAKANAKG